MGWRTKSVPLWVTNSLESCPGCPVAAWWPAHCPESSAVWSGRWALCRGSVSGSGQTRPCSSAWKQSTANNEYQHTLTFAWHRMDTNTQWLTQQTVITKYTATLTQWLMGTIEPLFSSRPKEWPPLFYDIFFPWLIGSVLQSIDWFRSLKYLWWVGTLLTWPTGSTFITFVTTWGFYSSKKKNSVELW